ncbi:uncharacterized protein LOC111113675 [Crassostrea virginica]
MGPPGSYGKPYGNPQDQSLCQGCTLVMYSMAIPRCPFPGVYGANCSIPCPDPNCRYCHIETGACQGCKPGYQGHQCEECEFATYGDQCKETCGQCQDLTKCHYKNGTCLTGCRAGYHGALCKTLSKRVDSCTDQLEFYITLGLFCSCLLLNGFCIAYIVSLRQSRSQRSQKNQSELPTIKAIASETEAKDDYQELGETDQDRTLYNALQYTS